MVRVWLLALRMPPLGSMRLSIFPLSGMSVAANITPSSTQLSLTASPVVKKKRSRTSLRLRVLLVRIFRYPSASSFLSPLAAAVSPVPKARKIALLWGSSPIKRAANASRPLWVILFFSIRLVPSDHSNIHVPDTPTFSFKSKKIPPFKGGCSSTIAIPIVD